MLRTQVTGMPHAGRYPFPAGKEEKRAYLWGDELGYSLARRAHSEGPDPAGAVRR